MLLSPLHECHGNASDYFLSIQVIFVDNILVKCVWDFIKKV